MDSGRWRRIGEIFERAAHLRSAEEQQAFLGEACGEDDELRFEVERLLAGDKQPIGWLDHPVCRIPDPRNVQSQAISDRRIGPYRLLRKVAEGGMGTIYAAERDDSEYRRQVAIKLVRNDLKDPELIRRFRNERQILAALEHPGIARLYDGGTTDDGHPYLAMEYISGHPIHEHCNRGGLTIDQRLEIFLEVCDAVHYAHGLQVVHRDLKPSNVLVTDEGHPKLLDFGIAKLLRHRTESQIFADLEATLVEQRPFTPGYASPEQIRGEAITPLSDLYSLGVLLYELLTGVSPYRLQNRSSPEVMRAVCEQEIERPSQAVDSRLEGGQAYTTTLTRLKHCLRGDLDNIILMALHKEPENRYRSVDGLAADLRRYLQGQPVLARPASSIYRMKKFVRRHPAGVVLSALLALVIVIFALNHDYQTTVIERQQEREQEVARGLTDLLIKAPEPAVAQHLFARDVAERLVPRLRASAGDLREEATLFDSLGQIYQLAGMGDVAHGLFSEALNLRQQLPTSTSDELADSLHHLGAVETNLGKFEKGGSLLQQAFELRENLAGQQVAVARSKEALALNHWAEGNLETAEKFLLEAIAIRDCECPEGINYWAADTMDHLAALYTRMGRFGEAEKWMMKSRETRRRFPENQSVRLASLDTQAALHFARGEYIDAERIYRQTLAERRTLITNLSPRQSSALDGLDLALSENLHSLARCLGERGAYEEAETFFTESLAIERQFHEDDHPLVLTLLNNLAVVLGNKGDDATAEALFLQVLERRRQLFGEEHPHVGQVHYSLGHLLHNRGALEVAELHYQKAAHLLRKTLPSHHPAQAYPKVAMARLALDRGQAQVAEGLLRSVLENLRSSHAPGHWRIAEAKNLLGAALAAREPTEGAIELLREGAEVLREQRGERAPRVEQALARVLQHAPSLLALHQ